MRIHIASVTFGVAVVATTTSAIWADTTWTAGSVHTLIADFVLADKLIIEEGVTIAVASGATFIIAGSGELVVEGTSASPTLFTSNDAGRWGGIEFQVGSKGSLVYAIVEHCDSVGISITSASPSLESCLIQDISSSAPATAAVGISAVGLLSSGLPARPIIAHTSIIGVTGATAAPAATGAGGPNGPNGSNGTNFAPNGGSGGAGGAGGTGTNASAGGNAYGVLIGGGAGGVIILSDIRAITGGTGGIGGTGGKGGNGGDGGDGESGVFNGNGGSGAGGGKGGSGGVGGVGADAAGIRLDSAHADSLVLDGIVIELVDGGTGGRGGSGGAGGVGGDGGNGAGCGIPGCNGGDGGDAANGGTAGNGGQNGAGGAAYAILANNTGVADSVASLAHATLVGMVAGAGNTPLLCPVSNCCTSHPGTGCEDSLCSATVCAVDPFCCASSWDGICAHEAQQLCGNVCDELTVCGLVLAPSGVAGAGGNGGSGGAAFFPAQDGDDGSGANFGGMGTTGSPGADGASFGISATQSTIALVSSILELQASEANSTALQSGVNGAIDVRSSCVHGYQTISSGGVTFQNVVLADPGFVPNDSGTYELAANSPCIDAGTDVVLELKRSASQWSRLVSDATSAAFDEFFPGVAGGTGCLAQTPAALTLPGMSVTVSAFTSAGVPQCAITDGSTPSAVSDGMLSGPLGARVDFEFDPPIQAFYTMYGSMSIGSRAMMTLFAGNIEVAETQSAASPVNVAATGHGFVSSRPIDRVSITSLADTAMVVGSLVGLASGEPSLGVINIPRYPGPNGASVELDFAAGFDDVMISDISGAPRLTDGDDDGSAVSDMGAYEFQPPTAPRCTGDFNGDGDVNAADLAVLLGSWGPCPVCPADFDGNGSVDASDLAILLGSWGPCP